MPGWLVPAAFVGVIALGATLAQSGLQVSGIEQAIATSVLILGLLIATSAKLPTAAGMALVGVFAAFHGFAHGAEMPATSQALSYGLGFILATALLHAAGVGLGTLAAKRSDKITKAAGWAIAASGVALLAL